MRRSLATHNCGVTGFVEKGEPNSSVAITTEVADSNAQLSGFGAVVKVSAQTGWAWYGDAASHNGICEIRGEGKPEEIIAVDAHLDWWGTGHGSHHDGGDMVKFMEVLRIIQSLVVPAFDPGAAGDVASRVPAR